LQHCRSQTPRQDAKAIKIIPNQLIVMDCNANSRAIMEVDADPGELINPSINRASVPSPSSSLTINPVIPSSQVSPSPTQSHLLHSGSHSSQHGESLVTSYTERGGGRSVHKVGVNQLKAI
jgi:hypothetical protein